MMRLWFNDLKIRADFPGYGLRLRDRTDMPLVDTAYQLDSRQARMR